MGRPKKNKDLVINPDDVVITQSDEVTITQTEPSLITRSSIQPVSVQPYAIPKEPDISVPDGYVYLVALDEQGQEKPSSGFTIGEADFYRYYNNDKFLLKKKANQ